jgi:hypothetical protein
MLISRGDSNLAGVNFSVVRTSGPGGGRSGLGGSSLGDILINEESSAPL